MESQTQLTSCPTPSATPSQGSANLQIGCRAASPPARGLHLKRPRPNRRSSHKTLELQRRQHRRLPRPLRRMERQTQLTSCPTPSATPSQGSANLQIGCRAGVPAPRGGLPLKRPRPNRRSSHKTLELQRRGNRRLPRAIRRMKRQTQLIASGMRGVKDLRFPKNASEAATRKLGAPPCDARPPHGQRLRFSLARRRALRSHSENGLSLSSRPSSPSPPTK